MNNLIAHEIPLTGKHLIEASAGTGKTFNITRIYLRMLLERKLSVEQILVMTFTKDATEEIKGRIDGFIREAINNWQTLTQEDPFFIEIAKNISDEEATFILKRALLFLDEAAIFTIHGFCKRVLNQHAFASGVSFNAQMETDCQDIILQATQDWYRKLSAQKGEQTYLTLAEFWPTPNSFLASFAKAIGKEQLLQVQSAEEIAHKFQQLVKHALNDLQQNSEPLEQYLILTKKGADQALRRSELTDLLNWLSSVVDDINHVKSPMPVSFIDARRYSRSKDKAHILEILAQVNEVKAQMKSLAKDINRAKAYAIVRDGIYAIRQQVLSDKNQQTMLSFDDLIMTLANYLKQEQKHGVAQDSSSLSSQLFNQYPVAMVDEFQDTDPQQFTILQAIYYQQPTAGLFMIGDPKQAIYGFRGGDVFAYLSARKGCDYQWLMDTNWRSSAPMIQAYNRIFHGDDLANQAKEVFGYDIPYLAVKASPVAKTKRYTSDHTQSNDSEHEAALKFVHFDSEDQVTKQSFRADISQWCAAEIAQLLTPSNGGNSQALEQAPTQLAPKDIAILVRDGAEASSIKQALEGQGIASVFLSNRANLFHSQQAAQLANLLQGILFVENERYFTASLTSAVLGLTPDKLYQIQQDDFAWQTLKYEFTELRAEWLNKGFISMALKLMHEKFALTVHDNANGEDSQDRILTNFLHLFELLQTASQRYRQPQELLFWFEQQINADNPEIEAELRLESDDDLVRIVTQHGSKGLEYPVVFVPFATRHKNPLKFANRNVSLIEYHDQQGELQLSLGATDDAKLAMANEAYAESIRLLYVAITRAEQRCYICTTAFEQFYNSPLGRTLKWHKETDILQQLNILSQSEPNAISVQNVTSEHSHVDVELAAKAQADVTVPTFTSRIERDWWLSSFSALSKNLKHGGVSLPDRDSSADLPNTNPLLATEEVAETAPLDELRFTLSKGAHTGNLLHEILEDVDFSAADWHTAIKWPLTRFAKEQLDESQLIQWLTQIVQAPFSENNDNNENTGSLAQLTLDKTLRESEFYFPMEDANAKALSQLLAEHRATGAHVQNEQRNAYVQLPHYQKLKGMMHGFIDLVFEHNGKFYVCDYKSSHLGDHYHDYNNAAMRENIEHSHYDLQYLIYSLALHRQLQFTLPGYDVEKHFGGIYYLYLRGMTDDPQYQGCGVYHREITPKELTQLDNIFAAKSTTANELETAAKIPVQESVSNEPKANEPKSNEPEQGSLF